MVAETAKKFQALEKQAQTLMGVFTSAGYEAVSPALIQPADIFLDVIGETLRARTYVFTDPDGDELCLRPDLTVPTCRLHLARNGDPAAVAKYCYNGVAFRFQPQGASKSHPNEFRQSGIETFADNNPPQAEADTVATIIEALKATGLTDFRMRIGDLGLFSALLAAADMPERWRHRLMHHFWRPEEFRNELKRLSAAEPVALANLPKELVARLRGTSESEAEQVLAEFMDENAIDLIGARTISEIALSLRTMIKDSEAEPLSEKTVALIENYLGVNAPARAAGARLRDITRNTGVDISAALETYLHRLDLLSAAGVDIVHSEFSAEFGRTLEYYTGFVFEVSSESLGLSVPIAGGGRYDKVLSTAGADGDIPAVGAAIHTERLLAVVSENT